ncbi:MAG: polysaccharide deacetylase family protein [Pseudomonadota bacterium]
MSPTEPPTVQESTPPTLTPIPPHAVPAPLLCVSIHDVAPGTWDDCARLAAALREVADLPLSWLVVPRYHERADDDTALRAGLDAALARGDELVLHGYTHLDTADRGHGLRQRFLRGVYTQREGEFAALDAGEARRRIELGLDWFRERGWPAAGFVAPAWLLGQGAWAALKDFPFAYTTTFTRFHLLDRGRDHALFAPSLVYAARNRTGRALSPVAADLAARWQARSPLVRLSLHPPDVRHPRLLAHAQDLVERLLLTRQAVTKETCARIYQPRPQNPPRQPGPQAPP